jgi:hypothetical protein
MKNIRRILIALAGVAALALPATALAGNPSTGDVLSVSGSSGGGGSLPFTGMNLAVVVGIGIGLLILGFVLRRRTGNQTG